MAAQSGTKFNNPVTTDGYVIADGFLGAPSTTDTNNQRLSTQPALFQNGLTSTGAITANGGVSGSITGVTKTLPQIVNAAGTNQQSVATAVTPGRIIVATVSATTRAIRLSVLASGNEFYVFNDTATAVKVYPATNGTIGASSTNTAVQVSGRKGTIFYCKNTTHVVSLAGA